MSPSNTIRVDLRSIQANLTRIRTHLNPGVGMLFVVKANAYGHGMIEVARSVEKRRDIVCLGVASAAEAFELRRKGIRKSILILGVTHPADMSEAVRRRIAVTLSDWSEARRLNDAARKAGRTAVAHIELDTGMGRLGVDCGSSPDFFRRLRKLRQIRIEGIYSHFPSSGGAHRSISRSQITQFEGAVREYRLCFGRTPRYVHMANSAGILEWRQSHFNLVRPGLMAYGIPPHEGCRISLRPALSLKSRVCLIKTKKAGATISYARTHRVRRSTRIAVIPIGYSGGYPFELSNRAKVLIRGRQYRVVGRVTMDHLMADIGKSTKVKLWDEVVLIGVSGKQRIRVSDLAGKADTIPYEILCSLDKGIRRVYV